MGADAENTAGKQRGRPFARGQSGNPAGKPAGARHATTRAVEALLEGEAEALTRKAVEMALSGDGPALRLCLDRIAPARKDAPVSFELPPISTAADAVHASSSLLSAVLLARSHALFTTGSSAATMCASAYPGMMRAPR